MDECQHACPNSETFDDKGKSFFYEKFQKKYYEGDYKFLNSVIGTSLGLQDVQNIFIGNPIDNIKKVKLKRIDNPKYYVLINTSSR